ncbi:hypothetical protein [Candidatus Poriferisodalis sp.]|uniref:hypothetical protein n=1 Tax=Candidatus Poriferisodalis sp. TaxID=3101277 RepID=UPI003B02AB81
MTYTTHQVATGADERSAVARLLDHPVALIATTLTGSSLAYVSFLTISDGWLGAAKAWLTWPAFTILNLAATAATFLSAWLTLREFKWSTGGQRAPHAAVFTVSAVLFLAFIVSAAIAIVVLAVYLLGSSDDDNDNHFRGRPHRRRRKRRSGQRNRHRSRSRSRLSRTRRSRRR